MDRSSIQARALAFLISAGLAQASFGQVILRVDGTNGSAAGDGSAWGASSFQFLQDALAAAAPLASGGQTVQIWIAQGTYKPDRDAAHPAGTGDRTATFAMMSRVEVYGGFAGSETSLDQRDPAAHVVTLSGDLLGDDGAPVSTKYDNCIHVLVSNNNDATTLLDGVTVASGYIRAGDTPLFDGGAGVRASASDIRIRNTHFVSNATSGLQQHGGGVLISSGAPIIDHCQFSSNRASGAYGSGGALYSQGSPVLTLCAFDSNTGTGWGGAIYAGGSTEITGCTFTKNRSGDDGGGGAVRAASPGPVIMRECLFSENNSVHYGGAVSGAARVDHCVFERNGAAFGGATSAYGEAISVIRCVFTQNSATSGGGACAGSGPYAIVNSAFDRNTLNACYGGPFTVANSVFRGNTLSFRGTGTLVGCTIVGDKNSAPQYSAVMNEFGSGTVVVLNSILWNNGNFSEAAQIRQNTGGTVTVNRSLVQGWSGSLGGIGNSGADPRFVDGPGTDGVVGTADDNLRLSWDSPCIDAGDTTALPPDTYDLDDDGDTTEPLPIDFDGLARRFDDFAVADTGVGPAPVVDIGTFEYRCLADFDSDGFVTPADMNSFLDEFVAGTAAADIDRNGFTNGDDFDLYAAALNAGC